MKNILVMGAGRSSLILINYLLKNSASNHWKITVGDHDLSLAQASVSKHPNALAVRVSADNTEACDILVQQSDIVISMLPHFLHTPIAKTALKFGKHFLTASYLSPEVKALNFDAMDKNIIMLNEMGLDPGIDHMSAMKIIDKLKAQGAELQSFKSYTGGLIAPENDTNPWNYKFTWNPRNVVLAGQGTARYIINKKYKYMPYHRLFSDLEKITIDQHGDFEGYPNRNSLKYRTIYGLEDIPTLIRGTLRKAGFCKSWDAFVQLGMTDDTYVIENSANMTYRDFVNTFLPYNLTLKVPEKVAHFLGITMDSEVIQKLDWLGIFGNDKIGLSDATPAKILQHLLQQKWKLEPEDRDMIVMQHIFEYQLDDKLYKQTSSLVVKGDDNKQTAMAKTVGLPLGIVTKLILNEKITLSGVQLPIAEEIYDPVLAELSEYGITFKEEKIEI